MKKIFITIFLFLNLFAVAANADSTAYVCNNIDKVILELYSDNVTGYECNKQYSISTIFAMRAKKNGVADILSRDCGASGTSLVLMYKNRNISFDINSFVVPYLKYVNNLVCNHDITRLKKLALFTSRPTFSEVKFYKNKMNVSDKYVAAADMINYLQGSYESDQKNDIFKQILFRSPTQIEARQVCYNNLSFNPLYGHKDKKYLKFLLYLSQNRIDKVNEIIDSVDLTPLKTYCSDYTI